MLFSGIPFLFYFLPVVAVVYFCLPWRLKNGWLLFASLFFYAWGEPRYVLLMAAAIVLFYGYGIATEKCTQKGGKRAWLTLAILTGVAMLAVFKYGDFALENWNLLTGMSVPLLKLALPIGISFYTFQSLSYTVDVYRGNVPAQKNPISFGAYVTLFPQLIAGPIVRYADVARELEQRTHSWENIAIGARRFLIGLGKKVLIADQFALFIKLFRETQAPSVLFSWLYAIAFMLNIYFDFSGYSDMAIGLGRIFGFRFNENFNYPYISKSITEFWRRWHMSLGGWFRDYVYIPLGGNRVSKGKWVRNILIVWLLTGLWHGAAWNFVLWGLFFAAALLLEKWIPALQKLPAALRHGYVLMLICLSFVLFHAEDLPQAGADCSALFGFANLPVITGETLYYLRSYGILFIAGIVGATPWVKGIAQRFDNTRMGAILEPLLLMAILLLCTAYLVDGSFSPFLYFRF